MEPSRTSERIIAAALAAVTAIEEQQIGLDDWLDNRLALPEERRSIASLLFTYFRCQRRLAICLDSQCTTAPTPALRRLLLLALALAGCQRALRPESAVNIVVDMTKKLHGRGAGNFANAVLRKALTCLNGAPPPLASTLPEAVERRWRTRMNDETFQRMNTLFQSEAPFTFRLRSGFDPAVLAGLDAQAVDLPWAAPWRCYTSAAPGAVLAGEAFATGAIYIQDPAPMLAAALVDLPGTAPVRVLDMCAAPGGKTLMLAERLGKRGKITALDRSAKRQLLTRENFKRCHVKAEMMTGDAVKFAPAEKYDLVLLDVPCSNSGVFRRRPDALWRLDSAAVREAARIQKRILANAALLVAPAGGELLYSSCSLEPEENQEQIAAFLALNPDFQLTRETQLLPELTHDGAYAALLTRR